MTYLWFAFSVNHHLRAHAKIEGLPEDSDQAGPWVGEEILRKARDVRWREENLAKANEKDPHEEQAEETKKVIVYFLNLFSWSVLQEFFLSKTKILRRIINWLLKIITEPIVFQSWTLK